MNKLIHTIKALNAVSSEINWENWEHDTHIDKKLFIETYFKELKPSLKSVLIDNIYSFCSSRNTGHYHYASETQIDLETERQVYGKKRIEKLIDKVLDKAKSVYMEVCLDLEKQGYKAYEYLYSDEYAKDTCEANEYTFLENGKMFN